MPTIAALAMVYACGYVTGSLLVAPQHDRTRLSVAVVRLIAGLFLTAIAFLLSLEFALPWFSGPVALLALAVIVHRRAAFLPPRPTVSASWDHVAAGAIAIIALAPPVISALRMAPGHFPPMFFNVDIPYFLEKVHALVGTQVFPPESLSVVDGRRPYHFGLHGIAALISRGSGLAPHHAVFLILVPLLTTGILAAAVVLARGLAPAVPSVIALPLLVISVPTVWYDFWRELWPALMSAVSTFSLDPLNGTWRNWELWGLTSNIQNLAGHFLVMATLAAIVNAPAMGWQLPAFLVGSAMIFKSPAGVALAAGFGLSQLFRAAANRTLRPVFPVAAAAVIFAFVYGAFWILPPLPAELKAVVSPLFYLDYLNGHGGLHWFVADLLWLVLPGLIALAARLKSDSERSVSLLFFALGPFIVVNVLRLADLRGFLTNSMNEDDWRQVIMPLPLILHAFVLSVLGPRWAQLGRGVRAACLSAAMCAVLPPALVAARYAHILVFDYDRGHEFADNRAIGAALEVIPTRGTLIVTNDLRYPADGFRRDNRQMQIPSLFGHQAFAVNYVYEAYSFSQERLQLQALLEAGTWSPAIDEAARTYHWTHLLIRKDYPHPEPIPLERVFENGYYEVFRFP